MNESSVVKLEAEFWTFWKNKRSIHINGPQLNITASIMDLLKIFSEVIVASKCGLLARIEK